MSPSTIVSLAVVAVPLNLELKAVRGTQVAWTVTLENDDGTNPDLSGTDVVEFTLRDRKGGVSKLTKALTGGTIGGAATLTLTAAELTFNGISDDLDYEWVYAIRRQVGASGDNEIVYIEGTFHLLTTASAQVL